MLLQHTVHMYGIVQYLPTRNAIMFENRPTSMPFLKQAHARSLQSSHLVALVYVGIQFSFLVFLYYDYFIFFF